MATVNGEAVNGQLLVSLMPFSYEEFDLSDVRTYPLNSRTSKAKAADFGRPCAPGGTLGDLFASFPNMLAAADFRAVVRAIVEARRHESGDCLGPRRSRHQDRPRPDRDRLDGARIRLGDCHQRRGDHPRFRGRAGRRHIRGCGRSARPRPLRHGRGNRTAAEPGDHGGRRRRARHRPGRREIPGGSPAASSRAAAWSRPPRASRSR